MSYYADGDGTIKFKQKVDKTQLLNFLTEIEFDYCFDDYDFNERENRLNVYCSCSNYQEPDEVLKELSDKFKVVDGETIEYVGEDKSYWRYRYDEKSDKWVEESGEVTYPADECRIINLHDCDSDFLVKTNAPKEVIDASIEYKYNLLSNDEPMSSDFESMQEYIKKQNPNYIFEEIGYVNDIESYEW